MSILTSEIIDLAHQIGRISSYPQAATDKEGINECNLLSDELPHEVPIELELFCNRDSEDNISFPQLTKKSKLVKPSIIWRKKTNGSRSRIQTHMRLLCSK